MLQYLGLEMPMLLLALSAIFTFGAVIISLKLFKNKLPVDGGRDFAFNGKLSKGKQRGAGIVFICVFILSSLIFIKPSIELGMYYAVIFFGMVSGYLDDASNAKSKADLARHDSEKSKKEVEVLKAENEKLRKKLEKLG